MKSQILGSSYVARSTNAADNRMINMFPEIVPEGGKEAGFLSRAPGLRLVKSVGTGPIRGMWQFAGYAYIVSGKELYKLNMAISSAPTIVGVVTGSGPVSMADNGTQLFIACNPDGFIYNASTDTFAQIIDFPGAVTVGYIDGYFVFNEPNSQKLWTTTLYDGTSVDPLDFASAEGSPDFLVSLIVDHREVWLFGTNSVEVWYDSGNADFPLQRISGAFNEIGCQAPYSVAKLDNRLFWLGSDARGRGIVYGSQGYTGKRVSTHAVEFAIQNYASINDAIAYTYQQEGHAFYVLTFPSANATWVYDVATDAWHERGAFVNDRFTRHRSNCQLSFANEILVGDYESGNIYAFDLDIYSDNGSVQKWLRSWRALATGHNDLKRTAQHSLQLDCEVGVPLNPTGHVVSNIYLITENGDFIVTEFGDKLTTEESQDTATGVAAESGTVLLRWSDDGGHNWSNYHARSMGKIGETGKRVIWRRLGMTLKLRDRVYEVSGTDPAKIAIMGAEIAVSATNA